MRTKRRVKQPGDKGKNNKITYLRPASRFASRRRRQLARSRTKQRRYGLLSGFNPAHSVLIQRGDARAFFGLANKGEPLGAREGCEHNSTEVPRTCALWTIHWARVVGQRASVEPEQGAGAGCRQRRCYQGLIPPPPTQQCASADNSHPLSTRDAGGHDGGEPWIPHKSPICHTIKASPLSFFFFLFWG